MLALARRTPARTWKSPNWSAAIAIRATVPRAPPATYCSDGFSAEPTRIEPLPDWLFKEDTDLRLRLVDLDGDGKVDLIARASPSQHKIDTVTFTYFVMINDGTRIIPEQPQQVLRFDGTGTDSQVTDVNGDGRLDFVITKYVLPKLTDLVSGFRFERGAYVFFGKAKGPEPFERKPALRDEQTFTIDSLQDALVQRQIPGDLSGDGIADLVEADLTGRVAVRRITHEDGRLGGGSWELRPTPGSASTSAPTSAPDDAGRERRRAHGPRPHPGGFDLVLSRKGSGR